jgi:hypothetical protein
MVVFFLFFDEKKKKKKKKNKHVTYLLVDDEICREIFENLLYIGQKERIETRGKSFAHLFVEILLGSVTFRWITIDHTRDHYLDSQQTIHRHSIGSFAVDYSYVNINNFIHNCHRIVGIHAIVKHLCKTKQWLFSK